MVIPNYSPEQKQVFFSEYQQMERGERQKQFNLDPNFIQESVLPIPFTLGVPQEPTKTEEPQTETKEVQVETPEVAPEAKETPTPKTKTKQTYYKHDGREGYNEGKPDPETMSNKMLSLSNNLPKSHQLYSEIEGMFPDSKEDQDYLKKLGYLESGLNFTQSSGQYVGLYSMGPSALQDVEMNMDNYRNATANQHVQALAYKRKNLEDYGLYQFINQEIEGIKLNPNNLAAAQHLLGQKNVTKYIQSGGTYKPVDGNNVPITAYLRQFS